MHILMSVHAENDLIGKALLVVVVVVVVSAQHEHARPPYRTCPIGPAAGSTASDQWPTDLRNGTMAHHGRLSHG